MFMKITKQGKQNSILGWDNIKIINYGYDQQGALQQVLAVCFNDTPIDGKDESKDVVTIRHPKLYEDLFTWYSPILNNQEIYKI
jgi:hypothetical protein